MAQRLTGEKRGRLIMKVRKRVEKEQAKEKKEKYKELKGLFKPSKAKSSKAKSSRRAVARRAVGTQRLLGALGVTSQSRGRGRPSGTYKYNMPIQQYKRLQSQRKTLYDVYKQRQQMELQRRGLSPEQVQQLQYIKTMQEAQGVPQQQQIQQQFDVIDTPQSVMAPVDEDLEFRKFRADKTISPNTQSMLRRLRYIQLKPQRDDVENQRRLKERRIVASAGSLLATPYVFNRYQLDITGIKEDNILLAPNTFKNNPENNILKPRQVNILTPLEGNSIMKRRPDSIRII